jgi:hypothetical protein
MTVKELIAELQKVKDQDSPVRVLDESTMDRGPMGWVQDGPDQGMCGAEDGTVYLCPETTPDLF